MPNLKLFDSEVVEGVNPGHSFQDLSHNIDFPATFGKLYPTLVLECVAGDIIEIGNSTEIKFQPMHTPAFSRFYVDNHYFFSPLRHLDKNFEDFFTYAIDRTTRQPAFQGHLEVYDHSATSLQLTKQPDLKAEATALDLTRLGQHSLWDFFDLPVFSGQGTDLASAKADALARTKSYLDLLNDADLMPLIYPLKAYMHIWDEYYRDEDLYDPVWDYRQCQPKSGFAYPSHPLSRAWMKDYFTSARPWRQKGVAPRVPVSGTVDWSIRLDALRVRLLGSVSPVEIDTGNGVWKNTGLAAGGNSTPYLEEVRDGFESLMNQSTYVTTGGFDISDLRMAVQLQKYFELNSRAGNRFTEYLRAQYGAYPSDARLNRPELIGSCRQEVTISEVLQTSATDSTSPQANRAGTANTFDRRYIDRYTVEEPGYIICITSIMVEPAYQNHLSRMWTRRSNFDFYIPLFANLSEQAVLNHEVACLSNPSGVFGYQGRWNEYRTIDNKVVGALRSYDLPYNQSKPVQAFCGGDFRSLDFWHSARRFVSQPTLNREFIECNPRTDMFAVSPEVELPLVAHVHHKIGGIRPMPAYNNPGRLDHMN